MRHSILTFLFLLVIGTGAGFCFETDSDVMLFVPESVKDQALEKTLQYGRELYLRQDFDQAVKLLKHVIALDTCNPQARDGLKMIADRGFQKESINAYLNGLNCQGAPAPMSASLEQKESLLPAPKQQKTVALEPRQAAPISKETSATATSQHGPLQGLTLQEKLANLQKRIQRAEDAAQSQSTRLNSLDNESSTIQN